MTIARRRFGLLCLTIALGAVAFAALRGEGATGEKTSRAGSYIVMFDDSVSDPAATARAQAKEHGAEITSVYTTAVKGYAAQMPTGAASQIADESQVAYVQADHAIETLGGMGVQLARTFAPDNANFDIDGVDDKAVDVDVAVLDTGVWPHSYLNVVSHVDCVHPDSEGEGYEAPDYDDPAWHPSERLNGAGNDSPYGCMEGFVLPIDGHGGPLASKVGMADGPIDPEEIVTSRGIVPRARIWNVRVTSHDPVVSFYENSPQTGLSNIVAGVDWVTANADQIEVANMSVGCKVDEEESPWPKVPGCDPTILDEAIAAAVDAGVVMVAAAGNKLLPASGYGEYFECCFEEAWDVSHITPAGGPDVISVSNMADFDGLPGGLAEDQSCGGGAYTQADDTLDSDSFSGLDIEIAAPTRCGGTSGAAAMTSGAAAALASMCNPNSQADVEAIKATLIAEGNKNWTDDSGDGEHEPLLDVSDETVFNPVMTDEDPPLSGCEQAVDSDVNGDGRADLVTLRANGVAYVHPGGTDSKFGSGVSSFSGSPLNVAQYDGTGHYAIDVADVTADKRADLITLSDDGDVHVFPGSSGSTFGSAITSALGMTPALLERGGYEPIAVADVDASGRADLIAYDDKSRKLVVHRANADGSFGAAIEASAELTSALHTGSGHYFIDAADVTGDRRADLVSVTVAGDLNVFAGQRDGTLSAPNVSQAGAVEPAMDDGVGYEPIGLGDVTGDGKADLAVAKEGNVYTYPGQNTGSPGANKGAFGTQVKAGAGSSTTFGNSGTHEAIGLLDSNGNDKAELTLIAKSNTKAITAAFKENGSFETPITSEGTFPTTQHFQNQTSSGNEFASEKPSWRRRGCTTKGCGFEGADTIGMYRPGDEAWYMRNTNSSGATDLSFGFSLKAEGQIPLTGDWDGDGDDTIGFYRPVIGSWSEGEGVFHLRNSNSAGSADLSFAYNWLNPAEVPVVGDWDGDGKDTIGQFQPGEGKWHLRNSNSSGAADYSFAYNWGAAWDVPITGDWNGE